MRFNIKPPLPIKWNENKCIHCGACIATCEYIQTINAVKFDAEKRVVYNNEICAHCGQCVLKCPVGALGEVEHLDKVKDAIKEGKYVVAQIAPSVRASFGEFFNIEGNVAGKLVKILKMLGVKRVFDTNLGADVVSIEEGKELLEILRNKGEEKRVLFSSCCPSWVYLAKNMGLEEYLSNVKSPHLVLGEIIKNIYSAIENVRREDIFVVSIMPCISKKTEIMWEKSRGAVDAVLTTRELLKWIKERDIDFNSVGEEKFDSPLGRASKGGTIFGASGGVAESVIKVVYEYITGCEYKEGILDLSPLREDKDIKEVNIKIGKISLRIGVANGLKNIKEILKRKEEFDFIEMMACPGGCVGGGGQPKSLSQEKIKQRAKTLYNIADAIPFSSSLHSPDIISLYENYLNKEEYAYVKERFIYK